MNYSFKKCLFALHYTCIGSKITSNEISSGSKHEIFTTGWSTFSWSISVETGEAKGGWGGGGYGSLPHSMIKMIRCYHEWSVSLSLVVWYTARGMTVARTASTHNHLVQRVVILLFDFRTTVQQIITCKNKNISWEENLWKSFLK